MGTRHLTIVKHGGEIKVAQYGQWDGYPEGQGKFVHEFCSNKANLEKLKANLEKCYFLNGTYSEEESKKLWEQYKVFLTRDTGAEILAAIANSDLEKIALRNNLGFGKDSLFCEWAYMLDLDENKLIGFCGFNKDKEKQDPLFAISEDDPTFRDSAGYYGIRRVAEFKLDDLPPFEEYENALYENNGDEAIVEAIK